MNEKNVAGTRSCRLLAKLLCQGSSSLIYTLRKACVHRHKFSCGLHWKKKEKGRPINRPGRREGTMGSHQEESPNSCKALNPTTHSHAHAYVHAHTHNHAESFYFPLHTRSSLPHTLSDQAIWKGASQADVLLLASQRPWVTDGGMRKEREKRQTSSTSSVLAISHNTGPELEVLRKVLIDWNLCSFFIIMKSSRTDRCVCVSDFPPACAALSALWGLNGFLRQLETVVLGEC